jgi:hypothetical protein
MFLVCAHVSGLSRVFVVMDREVCMRHCPDSLVFQQINSTRHVELGVRGQGAIEDSTGNVPKRMLDRMDEQPENTKRMRLSAEEDRAQPS